MTLKIRGQEPVISGNSASGQGEQAIRHFHNPVHEALQEAA